MIILVLCFFGLFCFVVESLTYATSVFFVLFCFAVESLTCD